MGISQSIWCAPNIASGWWWMEVTMMDDAGHGLRRRSYAEPHSFLPPLLLCLTKVPRLAPTPTVSPRYSSSRSVPLAAEGRKEERPRRMTRGCRSAAGTGQTCRQAKKREPFIRAPELPPQMYQGLFQVLGAMRMPRCRHPVHLRIPGTSAMHSLDPSPLRRNRQW